MDWARDRAIWPNADASRFVDVKPHRWHVQDAGQGPVVLLIHGAGGATQSWRALFPLLAEAHRVVAIDLPGQGFTRRGTRLRCGLTPMAEDVTRLMEAEALQPDVIVGHSAGAALALEMARQGNAPAVVGINAALGTFEGVAGWLFPLMAKFMALNPAIPPLLARMAGGEARVAELLRSTGSDIGPEGIALYRRLMTDSGHIDGTLSMMAQWNIEPLLRDLPNISTRTLLVTGSDDATVPPKVSRDAAARLPSATYDEIAGTGHLVHEEAPQIVADKIAAFVAMAGRHAATA